MRSRQRIIRAAAVDGAVVDRRLESTQLESKACGGDTVIMGEPSTQHEMFTLLVEQHQRALLKVCWAYGYTAHDRDDLFQEIAARLWRSFERYDRERPFSTWMFRIALNVAIDFRRRKRRWEIVSSHSELVDSAVDGSSDKEKSEQLSELRELLEKQTDADRAILVLHLEGNSNREIGEVIGISESNVGTRISRLKHAMKQSIRATVSEKGT